MPTYSDVDGDGRMEREGALDVIRSVKAEPKSAWWFGNRDSHNFLDAMRCDERP